MNLARPLEGNKKTEGAFLGGKGVKSLGINKIKKKIHHLKHDEMAQRVKGLPDQRSIPGTHNLEEEN